MTTRRQLDPADLDGKKLRRIVLAAKPEKRRSPSKKHAVGEVERRYGAKLGPELRALLSLRASHDLSKVTIGDWYPFYFVEPFHLKGRDAAKKHLERVTKLGWPVWFAAHFWALHPIGSSGGGDYVLAHVGLEDRPASPVYVYDHETGALRRRAATISAFAAAGLEHGRDAAKKVARRRAPKLGATIDPIALERRSHWLTELLRGTTPDDLSRELGRNAPSMRAFSNESAALSGAPHLALYWLFAHTLLGNARSLSVTLDATANAKNGFVVSARRLCERFAGGQETLGPIGAARMRRIVAALDDAPARVREKEARRVRANATEKKRAAIAEEAAGDDPLAPIARHPDDLKVHIQCLKVVAKKESAGFKKAVKAIESWAKRGIKPGETKKLMSPLDVRLIPTVAALLRAGNGYDWHEDRDNGAAVRVLAGAGSAEAMDALATEFARGGYNLAVARDLAVALEGSDDPRVAKRLESLVLNLTKKELRHLHSSVFEDWSLLILDVYLRRHHGKASADALTLVRKSLSGAAGHRTAWAARVARYAGEQNMKKAVPLLVKIVESKTWSGYWQVAAAAGGALSRIDPKKAAKVLGPLYEAEIASGKSWTEPRGYWDVVEIARWLPGLLGSSERSRYLDAAAHICATEQKSEYALHFVLDGLEIADDAKTRPWVEALTGYGKKGNGDHREVRKHATRVLEAMR